MTRCIALLVAAMGTTFACGGSVDTAREPLAAASSHPSPDVNAAYAVHYGVCQYNPWSKTLTGTCIADEMMECSWNRNNADCLNHSPLGGGGRLMDCAHVFFDSRRCRFTTP